MIAPSNTVTDSVREPQRFHISFFVSVRQLWDSIKQTVFIVGSALIVFAAARNTVTWHLQRFWGASGNYWQRQWEYIYDICDGSEFMLGFIGSFTVTSIVFWLFNAFWIVLDLTGKPQCLLKYKIQPSQNMPVDRAKFKKAVKWVLFNQFVVSAPFMFLSSYLAFKWRGCKFGRELPTFHWVVFEMAVFSLLEELCFYYSHRLLHHPRLYQKIHKLHHEWTSPIGIRSVYAHPVEHIISNLMGPVLGPFVMGSHIATAWLWFIVALMSTTVAHCGYHFPFLPSPEAHDFHHQKFINNFGVLGILDRLHGTDNLFRKSKAYQRHIFLTSFTPVRVMFPDDPPKGAKKE